MLKVDEKKDRNLIHLVIDDEITDKDIDVIERAFGDMVNSQDRIPSLVIEVKEFDGWDDSDAFARHFDFVKDHQKLVPKVAFVTDSFFLGILPKVANIFVGAQVLRFPSRRLEAAIDWASNSEPEAGGFEAIDGLPHDVIAYRAKGIIDGKAYENVLRPAIEAKLKRHDKLKLLVVFDEDFQSYTTSAVFNDARLGLSHFTDFSKIAIVTDSDSMANGIKLTGWMIPGEVATFELDELDDAKNWVKS